MGKNTDALIISPSSLKFTKIVPHDTEYIGNCYSDEILAEMEKKQMTEAVSVSHKKAQKRTGRAQPSGSLLFYISISNPKRLCFSQSQFLFEFSRDVICTVQDWNLVSLFPAVLCVPDLCEVRILPGDSRIFPGFIQALRAPVSAMQH